MDEAVQCYSICIQLQFRAPTNPLVARAVAANPQAAAAQQAQRLSVAYNNLGGILKLQVSPGSWRQQHGRWPWMLCHACCLLRDYPRQGCMYACWWPWWRQCLCHYAHVASAYNWSSAAALSHSIDSRLAEVDSAAAASPCI